MSRRRDRTAEERAAASTSRPADARGEIAGLSSSWPDDAEQLIHAIRSGQVDAFVMRGPRGEQIHTLTGAVEAYRLMLEGIQEGVVTLALDGTILYAGRRLADMLDASLQDLVGHDFGEIVAPEDREAFGSFLERAARDAERSDFRLRDRRGGLLPVFVAARPFDADGTPCLCAVVTDLSEQEIQERLRASEERFRLASRASRDVIWEWDLDPDGTVWVDPSHHEFGGDERRSVSWWRERIHPQDAPRVIAEVQESLRSGAERWESEFRLRRHDDDHRHVLNRALLDRDAEGRARRMIGVLADVTRDRQAASDLSFLADLGGLLVRARESEDVVKTVTIRLGAFLGADGCSLLVRESEVPVQGDVAAEEERPFERRLEQMGSDLLAAGKPFAVAELEGASVDPAAPDGIVACACTPCLEASRWAGTLVVWRKGPHAWEPRELDLMQATADRSWVALANAALNDEIARSSQQKDDFLATLSHELRNPLNPLKVAAELLREATPEHLPEIGAIVTRQVDHLGRLLDDLLDVARVTRGRIELRRVPVTLREVVDQAVESIRPGIEEKDQKLAISLPSDPLRVRADPVRLVQILANLVDNASKYSPSGAPIRIEVRREGAEAILRVQDEGRGIDPEVLPRIFELFVRSDRGQGATGGLGIGLHLVKQLVDLHGGSVRCASRGIGKGSEFTVRLPLLESPLEGALAPADAPARSRGSCRILVADDHSDCAKSLDLWLGAQGHEVRTVRDGHAALALAAAFEPDVAVLDLGMPGANGYEVARDLRANSSGARPLLVAVTGYTDEETRRRAAEAGFDHHLAKPVDLEVLGRLVQEHLDRAGRTGG